MDEHSLGVLEVNSIRVGAVPRGRDAHIMDQHSLAVVEFEMALGAILNRYACNRDIKTPIKPQCLHNQQNTKYKNHVTETAGHDSRSHKLQGFGAQVVLTVGLMLGIFPLSSLLICRRCQPQDAD